MKRSTPERGISRLSAKPADKLLAYLNHGVGVASAAVLLVIDAYTHARREAAEETAAGLPSSPMCLL